MAFFGLSRAFAFRSGALSIRIYAMETRMERYAKYREQIRHMREEDFPKKGNADNTSSDSVATFAPAEVSEQSAIVSPYGLYLRHRHKMLAVKIVALALVIAAFAVWWILMQGR